MIGENKFYLTKKGLEKIKKEYEELRKTKLAKIRGEAPSILHSEDLNPEYLSFREDMTFLERRIVELENILKNTELIVAPSDKNIVKIGATVTLEEKDGEVNEFMVVGTLEANPGQGKISIDSPVGRALIDQKIGSEIILNSPVRVEYKIKKIKYHLS
ncbi:MAG: GreA/GreB family elongation factor [Patescibacteria group bacterium]|nr:GreA/GreB family elongation factor [Patescibacteria group bacterium]MBU1877297.1 GreA/GreB family elongation factor [Patescibacteria group bacterium]